MRKYIKQIEDAWQNKEEYLKNIQTRYKLTNLVNIAINELDSGNVRVAVKQNDCWEVNEWVKYAILLNFMLSNNELSVSSPYQWYDKVKLKFEDPWEEEKFAESKIRVVPGATIRKGSYIGPGCVIMPSFINIGAYIGAGTMIDTWATVGSCAQIGVNCHISGGTGIGGVLEPVSAKPVIIEDNCFIGARSEIAEGVIVEKGSVISMGVFIGASTKIVERATGNVHIGVVPAYSVVVPGFLPASKPGMPGLACAVIVKTVDKKTREKTSINEILRPTDN